MKKIILLSLIISQALHLKAQINVCDSVSYTIGGGQAFTTTINVADGLTSMIDSIEVLWQICNTSMCYTGTGTTEVFQNILQTDTVKACYDVYVYSTDTSYFCHVCDSLLYNGTSWELLNPGNPNEIADLPPLLISDFYPNPAKEYTTINYNSINGLHLNIIDILGNKVKDIHLINAVGSQKIYVGDLSKGIYFGNLMHNDKAIVIKKLIVK
jgi:hypothetical protein